MASKRGRAITDFAQMFSSVSGAYIPPEIYLESRGWLVDNQRNKLIDSEGGKLFNNQTGKLAANIRGK